MEHPGWISGSNTELAVTADCERTVNFYVQKLPEGASHRKALYPTPGLVEVCNPGTAAAGRGHFFDSASGREFAVIGTKLYEIDSVGNITSRGTVAIDSYPATISSNGTGGSQLLITSGKQGYTLDLTNNSFATVVNLATISSMGEFMDGYFLCLDSDEASLYCSALLDGTTWDLSNFQQRNLASDPWVSMKRLGRYLWLFGTQTSEVWFDAGTYPFPLQAHPSGLVQYGIAARFSVAVAEAQLFWLASTDIGRGAVMRTTGFAPESITTSAVEQAINSYDVIEDAIGYTYDDLGHSFYILSFPTEGKTWAYDIDTNSWAERGTWISENGDYTYWRAMHHAMAYGEHRVLDAETSGVYRFSYVASATDVDGRSIRRLRRGPGITQENERLFYSAFELDLEPGHGSGVEGSQGYNPEVMLRISNDAGKTWGPERIVSAGLQGEYSKRVRWNRCGSGRRRVFEVSMTDPNFWAVTNCYLTLGQQPKSSGQQKREQ